MSENVPKHIIYLTYFTPTLDKLPLPFREASALGISENVFKWRESTPKHIYYTWRHSRWLTRDELHLGRFSASVLNNSKPSAACKIWGSVNGLYEQPPCLTFTRDVSAGSRFPSTAIAAAATAATDLSGVESLRLAARSGRSSESRAGRAISGLLQMTDSGCKWSRWLVWMLCSLQVTLAVGVGSRSVLVCTETQQVFTCKI